MTLICVFHPLLQSQALVTSRSGTLGSIIPCQQHSIIIIIMRLYITISDLLGIVFWIRSYTCALVHLFCIAPYSRWYQQPLRLHMAFIRFVWIWCAFGKATHVQDGIEVNHSDGKLEKRRNDHYWKTIQDFIQLRLWSLLTSSKYEGQLCHNSSQIRMANRFLKMHCDQHNICKQTRKYVA